MPAITRSSAIPRCGSPPRRLHPRRCTMKTDRLSVIRVLAVLLAILAVGQSAGGRTQVGYKFGRDHQVTLGTGIEAGATTVLAGALAKQARQVHDRFITK